jgi:hypothetical protein
MHKFINSIVSAALVFAATLALAGCGNALHDLHEKDGVQHPAVTFDKATGTLVQRGSFKFEATTSGLYGSRAEDVTWDDLKVVSGSAPGAKLSADGELSLRLSDAPGAVLEVTARSVRRPEISDTKFVKVEPFFVLEGVADDEVVTVTFTNTNVNPMTGKTLNDGVVFDQDDLPEGKWVIEKIEIGATTVLIGRPSGSVGEHGVSLAFTGGPGSYTLQHRDPVDGSIPIGSYAEFQLIYDIANVAGKSYKQEADLDLLGNKNGDETIGGTLEDRQWRTIGVNANRFLGTFDGDNKGVRNLYIDKTVHYQGLFGYVGVNSTISNVHIRSGKVTGQNYVGGVAGVSLGTITNCSNNSTVTGSGDNVGGVAGETEGTMENCHNSGTVSGANRVGGVVGSNEKNVTGCSNQNTGRVMGSVFIGGVVGLGDGANSNISNCHNFGTVTGNDRNTGGVAGENAGTMENCHNKKSGTVTGKDHVGGVVGTAVVGALPTTTGCSNSGTVEGSGENVGGVAGRNQGTVIGCSNSGTVEGGGNNVGGVAGISITVIASYNIGTVSGSGDNVGGVVGINSASSTPGTVTASYNTGTVTGSDNVGGVVGNNYHQDTYQGTVTASYWQSGKGVSVGIGYGSTGGDTEVSFSSDTAFPNLSVDPNWGTGSGRGASVTHVDTTKNDWWKPGTTTGGKLPKLWFE